MRVLGVDGGQSGIRLRAGDDPRTLELDGLSRGSGDIVAAVADAVVRGWREGGFGRVDRIVLGLTTAPADPTESERLGGLVAAATGAGEVWVTDDAVTAHAGALSGGPGVCVVAGTGVATLALPSAGGARIIGGHGFLLGDEGGAFWIGSRGIRAVLRAADRLGPETALTAAAERHFGPINGLHVRLHDAGRPVDTIARFAPDVLAAADAGDEASIAIAGEAARELVRLATAGVRWVADADASAGPVPVAVAGRLLQPRGPLRERFDAAIAGTHLAAAIRDADGTPLDGAIRLGATDGHRYGALVHRCPGGPR